LHDYLNEACAKKLFDNKGLGYQRRCRRRGVPTTSANRPSPDKSSTTGNLSKPLFCSPMKPLARPI